MGGNRFKTGVPAKTQGTRANELALMVVYAVIALIFYVISATKGGGILRLVAGDLALWFWVGLVLIGLLIPGLLIWSARSKGLHGLTAVAAFLCVVAGGLVVRVMLFPLGLRIPIESLW